MKEVLSQAEIDNLLAAVSSGEVTVEELKKTEEKVHYKTYDFRRPNKFSKEHLQMLQMLHESFARVLSNYLSGYLRANVGISLASVDQLTYEDFIQSLPSPTLLTAFSMKPLKGSAVIETNLQFLFPIIDLLLGGPGEAIKKVRELTDIELSVAKRVVSQILDNFNIAWADVYKFTAEIESVETNPHLHQLISPSEIVAVITFAASVEGTVRGLINICLPSVLLEPILSQLSAHYMFSASEPHNVEKEIGRLENLLGFSKIDLTAVVGYAQVKIKDFLQLQEGDVLVIDKSYDEDLDLYVGDNLKFKVQAGSRGRFVAVQVTSLAEEEKIND